MADPRQEYERRHGARSQRLEALRRQDTWFANGRLIVFAAGLAVAWAAFGPPGWAPATLAIPIAVFLALVVLHERSVRRIDAARRAVEFYEAGIARLEDRWQGRGIAGENLKPVDHLYAEDLDLFGPGSLFELLCTARTAAGEQTLAQWLCAPAEADEIQARQQAVAELRGGLDVREALALAAGEARSRVRPELLERWSASERVLARGPAQWASWMLTACVLGGFGAWAFGAVPLGVPVLALIPALLLQRALKSRVQQVLRAGDEPLKDLAAFAAVAAHLEEESFDSPKLRGLQERLRTGDWKASRAVALLARLGRWQEAQRNAMFAPIAIAVLWAVHFAYALEWWRGRFGAQIPAWLEAVGEFEALCALATYAYENPADPFPEMVAGRALYEGEELGHPLLPRATCVRNSVKLGEAPRMLIVSGSNMSGKSTLLRTVGINAVMGLAGAPVRAASLRLSPMNIGASLHIIDSIQRGTSHFYAEILRLRAIFDKARGSLPSLFLIDEILHGTNSHDRRSGAEAVLKGLIDAGAIGLVTTHDLALTSIAESLGGRADNVHFVDHIEDGRLVFDYRMRPGVVERSNALALMRSIGLEV